MPCSASGLMRVLHMFFQFRSHSPRPLGNGGPSQVKSSQVKSSQVKSSQVKSSQVKSSQVKSSQVKARQGKARQGKARQGKARQGKARQGKASSSYTRVRGHFGSSHFGTNATLEAVTSCSCTCVFNVLRTLRRCVCYFASPGCCEMSWYCPECGVSNHAGRRKCTNGKCRYPGGGATAWETKRKDCGCSNHGSRTVCRSAPTKAAGGLVGAPLDDLAKVMVTAVKAPREVSRVETGARQALLR